ncbi:DUF7010 family protein [Ammoniphilus oxalaticus]
MKSLQKEISIETKNGLPFLCAGVLVWMVITALYLQDLPIKTKNIGMLYATGLMFPFALGFAKFLRAKWKIDEHPLNQLGLIFNLAQLLYFPLVFWAFAHSAEQMVLFFAVITAAHFFPFGWLYQAKAYYILAPIFSVALILIGWNLNQQTLWVVPCFMVVFLLILSGWLYADYKGKAKFVR